MRVIVNGVQQDVPEGTSVRGLIERHKLAPEKVAIELNRRLVRSADYERILKEGDTVEIVTFVGGG